MRRDTKCDMLFACNKPTCSPGITPGSVLHHVWSKSVQLLVYTTLQSVSLCEFFFKSVQFLSEFQEPPHAAGLNKGSSAKTFSTRLVPSAAGGHWAETVVGKAMMVGSIAPGIWGSGFRGRMTPTSGPPAGTSGKEGIVTGRSMAGSILTMPSGWS